MSQLQTVTPPTPPSSPAPETDVDLAAYVPDAPVQTLYRHSLREQWGLSVVIRKLDDRVQLQFQDGRKRTFLDRFYDLIEAVDRPLDVTMGIVAGLREMFADEEDPLMTNAARQDPISLDEQILYFREQFAEGFQSAEYAEKHRGDGRARPLKRHRDPVVAKAAELLPRKAFMGDPTEVFEAAATVLSMTDLVPAKERNAFAAIDAAHHEGVVSALRALLYGESKLVNRFDNWVRALERGMRATPSWQLATSIPSLIAPMEHPAVRVKIMQRQAAWMAPGLRCSDRPMGLLYTRLSAMVHAVHERMEKKGLEPRDLLDVRDFMWLTLKPAGRRRVMELRLKHNGSDMQAIRFDDDLEVVPLEATESRVA